MKEKKKYEKKYEEMRKIIQIGKEVHFQSKQENEDEDRDTYMRGVLQKEHFEMAL